MLNTMHLFAGRGGGLLADLILGHNPIIAVEWDHEACENLRQKASEGLYPNLHVWEGDVRLFDPSKYKDRVDCIHAGFPCQDISQAGKQTGLGAGTRSGLYREVLRIAGEIRPKYIFLENVAAIINNGLGTVLADISKMGYDCRWCVVSASDVGVNHQRDRWWCLCTLRDSKGIYGAERNLPEKSFVRRTQIQSGRSGSTSGIYKSRNYSESTNIKRNVANTNNSRQIHRESEINTTKRKFYAQRRIGTSSEEIPNTDGTRHNSKEQSRLHTTQKIIETANNINDGNWWQVESTVCRMVDGVSDKLHTDEIKARLFGLGNAQVPLAAAVAWKILTKDLITERK